MWVVVDNAFNRENYPRLIGKKFVNPPAYVAVLWIEEEVD